MDTRRRGEKKLYMESLYMCLCVYKGDVNVRKRYLGLRLSKACRMSEGSVVCVLNGCVMVLTFYRLGITGSNAPFLQMSYETSFKFLTEACERAAVGKLQRREGSSLTIVGYSCIQF